MGIEVCFLAISAAAASPWAVTSAVFVSDTAVRCAVPYAASESQRPHQNNQYTLPHLRVHISLNGEEASTAISSPASPSSRSTAPLLGGRRGGGTYTLLPAESILDVTPAQQLSVGGARVFVRGDYFSNSTSLSCVFGPARVRATFYSHGLLSCIVPSRTIIATAAANAAAGGDAVIAPPDSTATVRLRVSNNGFDASRTSVPFTYIPLCPTGHYCPSLSRSIIWPCPNGTACPGQGNVNYSLCVPGTFGPRAAASMCVPCPVGYVCPAFGMSAPALCPAGYVCAQRRLTAPSSPCPAGHWCAPGTKTPDPLDFDGVGQPWGIASSYASSSASSLGGTSGGGGGVAWAWVTDPITGVAYFNLSARGWPSSTRSYPSSGVWTEDTPPADDHDDDHGVRYTLGLLAAERPRPCPLGYYCRSGVATDTPSAANFSTPQACLPGYFCPRGSGTPTGAGPCPTGYFCPNPTDAVPCPRAHACAGVANTRPTACAPGSYNPLRLQSACTLCPPGHVCPRWGMLQPELCPAGFVCSEFGLPQPAVMCPPGFYCPPGMVTDDISASIPEDPEAPPYEGDPIPGVDRRRVLQADSSSGSTSSGRSGGGGGFRGGSSALGDGANAARRASTSTTSSMTGVLTGPNYSSAWLELYSATPASSAPSGPRPPWLNASADGGAMTAARALILSSLVSGPAAPTYAYFATAALAPIACPPGVFCLGGVRTPIALPALPSNPDGITSAQPCPEGAYCRWATRTPAGSGTCFPGHYCPLGATYPVASTPGSYTSSGGSVVPTLCFPGTYAPFGGVTSCRVCPAGYECIEYGTYAPTVCGAGTYRSLADSIACVPCPEGTFSPDTGNTDISDCQPCPAGRVCDRSGMGNLSVSIPCPPGYACGVATTSARQFDHECPAGVECFDGTAPSDQLALLCPPGAYCLRGTKGQAQINNPCLAGYFCPQGTAADAAVETACPRGTASRAGATTLTSCGIRTVSVCSKQPNERYYDGLTYSLDGGTVLLGTAAGDDTSVIEVEARINPVNVSASDAYWVNDTIALGRVCPTQILRGNASTSANVNANSNINSNSSSSSASCAAPSPPPTVLVFGRNFDPSNRMFCRWSLPPTLFDAANSSSATTAAAAVSTLAAVAPGRTPYTLVTEGSVLSVYRLLCPAPDWANVAANVSNARVLTATWTLLLDVATISGGWSGDATTPQVLRVAILPPLSYIANASTGSSSGSTAAGLNASACAVGLAGEEAPLPSERSQRWFELRGLNVAHISFSFGHIPEEMVYGEHWLIAIYVTPSLCPDSQCDGTGAVVTDPALTLTSPCSVPLPLSTWFLSPTVDKHGALNISLKALEDVRFSLEVQLLYGLFVPAAPFFGNTTSVRVTGPTRARMQFVTREVDSRPLSPALSSRGRAVLTEYTWSSLYYASYTGGMSPPLNLPTLYAAMGAGRVLPDFNVSAPGRSSAGGGAALVLDPLSSVAPSAEYWQAPKQTFGMDFVAQTLAYREIYQDIVGFHVAADGWNMSVDDGATFDFHELVLPYVPYVSNCYGFDSHIPWFELLEDSSACGLSPYAASDARRVGFPPLPNPDDFVVVGPLQFLQMPVADACYREISCNYEENLPVPDPNPRWFEVGSVTEMWRMLRNPITQAQMASNGGVVDMMLAQEGIDVLIPVYSDRSAAAAMPGVCLVQCFPRTVTLQIEYYQVSLEQKRLLRAKLIFNDFDLDDTNTAFTFAVNFFPLSYMDLVIAFAFTPGTYIVIFFVVGWIVLALAILFWLFNRSISRLSLLPPFKWASFLALTAPPIVFGIGMATAPMVVVVGAIYMLMKGNLALYGSSDTSVWGLDALVSTWGGATPTSPDMPTVYGREGVAFLVFGLFMLVVSVRVFIPRKVSKHERELEAAGHGPAAGASVGVWTPTAWKRAHMLLVALVFSVFISYLIEISFWNGFGAVQWYFIAFYYPIGVIVDMLLEVSLREKMLTTPMSTVFAIMQGLVTFGATDFLNFMLSFAVDVACAWGMGVYIGPAADQLGDWSIDAAKRALRHVRELIRRSSSITLTAEVEKEADDHASLRQTMEEKPLTLDEMGGTVEAVVRVMRNYVADVSAAIHAVEMILLFMLFRTECGFPDQYSIKETDMKYYLYFAIILLGFKLMYDQFVFSAVECTWGIKLHDYLVYARYRFLKRETRWKGMERHMDECVDEGFRSLDAMTFSSQFYFMNFVATQGMFMTIFGMQIIKYNGYNPFNDPVAVLLIPVMLAFCYAVLTASVAIADGLGVWVVVPRQSSEWHASLGDGRDDAYGLPDLQELENMKAAASGGGNAHAGINSRITSETFRYRFLDYTRLWLVEQLPAVLTPRTMRRARPYLLVQFAKLLLTPGADGGEGGDGEGGGASSSSGGGSGGWAEAAPSSSHMVDAPPVFGVVRTAVAGRALAREWLSAARRRVKLRDSVSDIILQSRRNACEVCLARDPLVAHPVVPISSLGAAFEASRRGSMDELDIAGWRSYFKEHARFRTLCKPCARREAAGSARPGASAATPRDGGSELAPTGAGGPLHPAVAAAGRRGGRPLGSQLAGQGDAAFGPVFLSPLSASLIRGWLGEARARTGTGGAATPSGPVSVVNPLSAGARQQAQTRPRVGSAFDTTTVRPPPSFNLGAGEGGDEAAGRGWARRRVVLNPASRALAARWIALARYHGSTRHAAEAAGSGGGSGSGANGGQAGDDSATWDSNSNRRL